MTYHNDLSQMIADKINKAELCELIPHSGSMCLIDAVEFWDDTSIRCCVYDIYQQINPLMHEGRFSLLAAIELGAQSMAVHGGLLAKYQGRASLPGYLAAVKNVVFNASTIDTTHCPLTISSKKLLGDDRGQMYDFTIASTEQTLLTATTTVISWE